MHAILLPDAKDPAEYWSSYYEALRAVPTQSLRRVYQLSPVHRRAVEALPPRGRVVDAGCGFGILTLLNDNPNCEVVGVDQAEDLLRFARLHAPGATFLQGDLPALPLEDRSCAGYFAISALECTSAPLDVTLSEAWRVLEPGGRLFVAALRMPLSLRWRSQAAHTCTLGDVEVRRVGAPPDDPRLVAIYYPGRDLAAAARRAGFEAVEVRRADLLGGLGYAPALGPLAPRLRAAVQDACGAYVTESDEGGASWLPWLTESGPRFDAIAPAWRLLSAASSYWNVLVAQRPT